MAKKQVFAWEGKIGNVSQLGGIETSVLDNGPGRGVRIAWVNAGAGLRYKVVIDRSLDIEAAFFQKHSLAWLSHGGITAPRPDANRGFEWLYPYFGGLLTTCGLTHTGGPETDENGERGLHGRISNIPASLESVVQPNPFDGKMEMRITGTMKESTVFGTRLELRRTISSTLGESVIRIDDEVTNRGNQPTPHMILYHCNFGWPLVDEGTKIYAKGKWHSFAGKLNEAIFASKHDFTRCCGPLEEHRGTGEGCGCADMEADSKGMCKAGLFNSKLGLGIVMRFRKKQLPWLTNWQHWGPNEYVCALEPGTNPPIGQKKAREQKQLMYLKPGQSRTYQVEIGVVTDEKQLR